MHEVCLACGVACVQRVSTNASIIVCDPFEISLLNPFYPK